MHIIFCVVGISQTRMDELQHYSTVEKFLYRGYHVLCFLVMVAGNGRHHHELAVKEIQIDMYTAGPWLAWQSRLVLYYRQLRTSAPI